VTINSVNFAGYTNEDNNTCYLGELDGTIYGDDQYAFPNRKTDTSTNTNFTINLDTPATGTMTFKPQNAQAAWVITLKGVNTSTGINNITTTAKVANKNLYDLSGRLIKANATAKDLSNLSKGVYLYNSKKFIVE